LFKNYLPRGFFVNDYIVIKDEYKRLNEINNPNFNPAVTAILERELSEKIDKPDSSYAKVIDFNPNSIKYEVYTNKQALFVMSEASYPPGWKLYIDNKEQTNHYRTDHAIQSTIIPEGNHIVELKFEPDSYANDLKISYASVSIIYLIILSSLLFDNRRKLISLMNQNKK